MYSLNDMDRLRSPKKILRGCCIGTNRVVREGGPSTKMSQTEVHVVPQ